MTLPILRPNWCRSLLNTPRSLLSRVCTVCVAPSDPSNRSAILQRSTVPLPFWTRSTQLACTGPTALVLQSTLTTKPTRLASPRAQSWTVSTLSPEHLERLTVALVAILLALPSLLILSDLWHLDSSSLLHSRPLLWPAPRPLSSTRQTTRVTGVCSSCTPVRSRTS